jgi:hypothetical protein
MDDTWWGLSSLAVRRGNVPDLFSRVQC